MCGCLLRTPYWGPGRQPRHVPWLGRELVTLWFAGLRSIHWATPARAHCLSFHLPSFAATFQSVLSLSFYYPDYINFEFQDVHILNLFSAILTHLITSLDRLALNITVHRWCLNSQLHPGSPACSCASTLIPSLVLGIQQQTLDFEFD